jgi:hypothetical protein
MLSATLKHIIKNNSYIKTCFSNKNKDVHSMCSLVETELSHSDCCKVGNGVEKVLSDVIFQLSKLEIVNRKPKNTKGEKEKDHLFCDASTKTIYYAELKGNLNLDTEKARATSQKCVEIKDQLRQTYPDYTVYMFLVGTRYYSKRIIPPIIMNKYKDIQDNVIGVNEYLHAFGIDPFEDETHYKIFVNDVVHEMFECPKIET